MNTVMPMPIIVHSNSHGHSGPWTESDTNLLIAIWITFTIIGLIGIGIQYMSYRLHKRKGWMVSKSFFEFVTEDDGPFIGLLCFWTSLAVQAVYAISLLIYGIYSIL